MSDELAHDAVVDAIRRAFAGGQFADGEAMLVRALGDGIAWDVVTRAVAEGVAHHYGTRVLPEDKTGGTLALA